MLEKEPLSPVEARQLIRRILREPGGRVMFSRHARRERMLQRRISEDEVLHCLRRGHCGTNITFENSSWRYPIETPGLTVVVAFNSITMAIVITTWRKR